jgi:response regulator RpfG family c-di-GMP phosphodiesterase
MTQVIDVFRTESGTEAALQEIQARRGTWFDPHLVDTLLNALTPSTFGSILMPPN